MTTYKRFYFSGLIRTTIDEDVDRATNIPWVCSLGKIGHHPLEGTPVLPCRNCKHGRKSVTLMNSETTNRQDVGVYGEPVENGQCLCNRRDT